MADLVSSVSWSANSCAKGPGFESRIRHGYLCSFTFPCWVGVRKGIRPLLVKCFNYFHPHHLSHHFIAHPPTRVTGKRRGRRRRLPTDSTRAAVNLALALHNTGGAST